MQEGIEEGREFIVICGHLSCGGEEEEEEKLGYIVAIFRSRMQNATTTIVYFFGWLSVWSSHHM